MRDEAYDRIAKANGYEDAISLIKTLYVKEGKSLQDVADVFGVHRQTIATLMYQKGIPVRPRPKIPHIPIQEIKEMSIRELTEAFGISESTAWRLKRKHMPRKKLARPARGGW